MRPWTKDVQAVLLADGWHPVEDETFEMVVDSNFESGGYRFTEKEHDGYEKGYGIITFASATLYGPWSAIIALSVQK